ncbi:peptide-methionine (S)-S-oxide reductase MsrA [Thalassotalea eurytherma]|uniref:Peptide methionine sulfoxide reductase MsrA n=1 Tax=Thalassotalea eurytherma TaxID=1144278 RepID=A0ABQ6H4L8_9GAMM|nr:peptide-methionine (S)-S-oxide reductase MsrA [Thalassotalea eurytherma]GLX82459.1 peptide methionine sulfoxide reductase MsrA [Thalassotalea eurytherma]
MTQELMLGAGCFWCIEAAYLSVKGVISVEPGYSGGHSATPSYHDVCRGITGHAEVIKIHYDDNIISTREILEIFFNLHDPTQLNRQGYDVGTQYRSAIFFYNDQQRVIADKLIQEINHHSIWPEPIVTEVSPAQKFYVAEQAHKDYVNKNPESRYCQLVVSPKLAKFKQTFAKNLK